MRVVYATGGWGIHDERWLNALRALGFEADAVSRNTRSDEDFIANVMSVAQGVPILAGPLHTVARPLVDAGLDVVGLSWGYDITEMNDLTWLVGARGLILDSQASIDAVMSAGVDPSRITFLPWGVDLEVFTTNGPRWQPEGLPSHARVVLSLRAHEPIYRVSDILDAIALLPDDVHLVLGHSGSLTQSLAAQAEELGITARVHAIGTVAEADLPALLRGADVYVSASEVDGTSVTLLQAMACGTPVAVSDIPGNRGWVEQGVTGRLFTIGDSEHAAAAISAALADPSVRDAARARVEADADWSANIQRLQDALL